MPCQDKCMSSRAARGDRKLGANGCRGASWSEQLDGKELRGALGIVIGTERVPVFWTPSAHPSLSATVWNADFKGLCMSCYIAVMQKSNTSYSSVFISRCVLSCIRISARSLPCSRSGRCSFREGCHLKIRAFAAGVCSGRVVSLMIARSLEYLKSELNFYTAVYSLTIFLS